MGVFTGERLFRDCELQSVSVGYLRPCCRCVPISEAALELVAASALSTRAGLKVCHNRRIGQHRVFDDLAARGKTSVDWFFGCKLHLVVNDQGERLNMTLTPGNTDDCKPVAYLLKFINVYSTKAD